MNKPLDPRLLIGKTITAARATDKTLRVSLDDHSDLVVCHQDDFLDTRLVRQDEDPFAPVFTALSKLPARQQAHILNDMLTDPQGLCLFNSPGFRKWLKAHRDNVAAYFKEITNE